MVLYISLKDKFDNKDARTEEESGYTHRGHPGERYEPKRFIIIIIIIILTRMIISFIYLFIIMMILIMDIDLLPM